MQREFWAMVVTFVTLGLLGGLFIGICLLGAEITAERDFYRSLVQERSVK